MASHNDASLLVDFFVDRGWDPIEICLVANSDLPRPSMVRHSTSGDDVDVDVVVAAWSLLQLTIRRRHSALCLG